MNKMQWNFMMVFSVLFMISGLGTVSLGIYFSKDLLAYFGIGIMAWTCVGWWFWVMFTIKDMFSRIDNASNNLSEVKQDIGIVRQILQRLLGKKR